MYQLQAANILTNEIKYCILFAWNHYKEIFSKIKKSNKIRWISHRQKIF